MSLFVAIDAVDLSDALMPDGIWFMGAQCTL